MSRDYRYQSEWRASGGGRRRSASTAAATAHSYGYGYLPQEREALQPRTKRVHPAKAKRSRRSAADRRFALFMVVLLAWAGVGYATGLVRIIALRRDIAAVQAQLAAAQKRNRDLEKTVAEMQTPEYIERAARDQLGLARPDEVRFVVGRSADSASRDVVRRPGSGDIYD